MAVRVKEDIIGGDLWDESGEARVINRIYRVGGVGSVPSATFAQRILQATDDTTGKRIASIGDSHDGVAGFVCERRVVRPFLNSKGTAAQARVFLTYRDLSGISIRLDGNVIRETTRFDFNGEILKVRYLAGGPFPQSFAPDDTQGVVDYAESPILRPHMVLSFEGYMIGNNPFLFGQSAVGRVNKDFFQSQNPHTWICTDVQGEVWNRFALKGQRDIWRTSISFEFMGYGVNGVYNSYDPVLIFQRWQTRRPPDGIDPKAQGFPNIKKGNGWRQVQIYPEYDFTGIKMFGDPPSVLPVVFNAF